MRVVNRFQKQREKYQAEERELEAQLERLRLKLQVLAELEGEADAEEGDRGGQLEIPAAATNGHSRQVTSLNDAARSAILSFDEPWSKIELADRLSRTFHHPFKLKSLDRPIRALLEEKRVEVFRANVGNKSPTLYVNKK